MKTINKKERIAKAEKRLIKLESKLVERLKRTDIAMEGAQRISQELAKLRSESK